MTPLTHQFLTTFSWVAEDQRLHRRFDDEASELYGVELPWSDEMKLLLELLEKLKAGKVECVEKAEPPIVVPDLYDHLCVVYVHEPPGQMVGYLSFWGDSARYLLAEAASNAQDPESWCDETTWRRLVGGSAGDFRVKEIAL